MRRRNLFVYAATLAVVASGCGGGDDDTGSTAAGDTASGDTAAGDTAAGEAPAAGEGGTIRIGIGGSADSLNMGNSILAESYFIHDLVYDTPLNLSLDNEIVPAIATEWSVADDGVTWTMTLRDDATFHDGTPLTSADVKFSIDLWRDLAWVYLSTYAEPFVDVQAPDPTTLTVTTPEPIANFESRMLAMYIVPMHIWSEIPDPLEFDNAESIGSGPFKLAEYKVDEFASLTANDDYWGGRPIIDGAIFQTISNSDALLQALRTGEIDVAYEFPASAIETLQAEPDIAVEAGGDTSLSDIFFNLVEPENCPTAEGGVCTGHPALRDVIVRQAMAMAIDKQALVDLSLLGYGDIGLSLVPTALGDFYADGVEDWSYDPAAANALLDEAGYADSDGNGIRECAATVDCGDRGELTFRFNFPTDIDEAPREADLLKQWWNAIGIDIQVTPLDPDAATAVCCPAFDFDIFRWGWTGGAADPDLLDVPTTDAIPTGYSETGWSNAEYDELFAQQIVETDRAARIELVHQMQQILIDNVVYVIPYYAQQVQAYRTDRFTNFPVDGLRLSLEGPESLRQIAPVAG